MFSKSHFYIGGEAIDTKRQEGESALAWARRILEVDLELEAFKVEAVPLYGLTSIKQQVDPFLNSVDPFPHTLLLGEPGIGKTHLARWIASERMEPFEEFLCPVGVDDLPTWGIILLDEAHRQTKPEPLFHVMENRHVTILAATTRPEKLEPAFRSRFFWTLMLKRYSDEEMAELMESQHEGAGALASAAAGNPRQAERIVATVKGLNSLEPELVLKTARITADGLTELQLDYLRALKRMGRPTGVEQLAVLVNIDAGALRDAERYLLERGLIQLTSSGRSLTRLGKAYMEQLNE